MTLTYILGLVDTIVVCDVLTTSYRDVWPGHVRCGRCCILINAENFRLFVIEILAGIRCLVFEDLDESVEPYSYERSKQRANPCVVKSASVMAFSKEASDSQ